MPHVTLASLLGVVLLLSCAHGEEPAAPESTPAAPPTQEELEQRFREHLSGATLAGHYTVSEANKGSDAKNGALPKEEKYTIAKVSKLKDDLWIFQVRIQYGDHDVALPLPIRVKWAGDTPVITLDKTPVPGLGTFSARVLIYDDKYAGTWGAADHGGLIFGRVIAPEKKPEKKPAKDAPAKEVPAKDGK